MSDTYRIVFTQRNIVGVTKDRAGAARLIDTYHRANNADDYWLWADKALEGAK